jgi:nitroreductase
MNQSISPGQLEHNLRTGRSIKAYKDQPVDRQVFEKTIDITRFSPTFHNTPTVHWIVVYEKDQLKRLVAMVLDFIRYIKKKESFIGQIDELSQLLSEYESGTDSIAFGAPHMMVAHTPRENSIFKMIDISPAAADCISALAYMELILPSFGLGSCRARYFDLAVKLWPPLQNALGFPRSHQSCGALLVGYPRDTSQQAAVQEQPDITWR